MVYDFEVFPLELELLVGKSSFTDHLLDRIYPVQKRIRQPLTVARTIVSQPIYDLVYNSTRIARLTFYFSLPSPPLPRQLSRNVSEVSICRNNRMHYPEYSRVYCEYRIHESWRNSMRSRKRIWREGNFRPVPNANGVSTSSLSKNLCTSPVDEPPDLLCDGLSFVRSEPITRLDFPRQ